MGPDLQFTILRGTLSDASDLRDAFGDRVRLVESDMQESGRALAEVIEGSQEVVVALHELRREHFEALSGRVSVIGRLGIGLDSIDLEAAKKFGVAVVHQPDYGTREVANHAIPSSWRFKGESFNPTRTHEVLGSEGEPSVTSALLTN